jgi:hypothetical protein
MRSLCSSIASPYTLPQAAFTAEREGNDKVSLVPGSGALTSIRQELEST